MRKPGEITVFLSLIIVCIMSLLAGLLESCRTAGARLYFQMASDSAMTSVMAHYNKNLWDMYGLLFLEYESDDAVEKSFADYFSYYEEQKNLYPMKAVDISMESAVKMEDNAGKAFGDEVVTFVTYALPSIAADYMTDEAESILKMSDFKDLLDICKSSGNLARNLQEKQVKIENALIRMEKVRESLINSAQHELKYDTKADAQTLKSRIRSFPSLVKQYENELTMFSFYREATEKSEAGKNRDNEMNSALRVDLEAYREAEEAAGEDLEKYRRWQAELTEDIEKIELIVKLADNPGLSAADAVQKGKAARAVIIQLDPDDVPDDDDDEDEDDPPEIDWAGIIELAGEIRIPEVQKTEIDEEKKSAIDAVEKIFDLSLLGFVLPAGSTVSEGEVSLTGIPSSRKDSSKDTGSRDEGDTGSGIIVQAAEETLGRIMIGQYALMAFDSFLEEKEFGIGRDEKELVYEQEYLLNGKGSDRKNLESTVLTLIGIRSASNLLYLLGSADKYAEASKCAALVSGGVAPLAVIMTFLLLTLWAMAEAVVDVRTLLKGKNIPFFKDDKSWALSVDGLLSQTFLNPDTGKDDGDGSGYEDYLRMLLFLENPSVRNFRMMDIIEWNVKSRQPDFTTGDCAHEITVSVTVKEKHLFAAGGEYFRTVTASGAY